MILYICDRKKCPNCQPECEHTKDISHAKNFFHTMSDDEDEIVYVELNDDEKEEEL